MKDKRRQGTSLSNFFCYPLVGLLALCFNLSPAYSQERFEFYTGVRQMGMGGAGVASVNDETSLLINPAALGKVRGPITTVIDPEVTLSTAATTLGIMNASNFNISGMLPPQSLLTTLSQPANVGKYVSGKFQVFPSFVTTNFGIGLLGKYQFSGEVDSTGTTYNLNYTNDVGVILGYNFRIWDGRIKLGFTGKAIDRTEIVASLPANSTGLNTSALAQEGFGVGSDIGLILTAPWAWLPSLSAVWRDVGNTSFNLNRGFLANTSARPRSLTQDYDVGFSVTPILGNGTRMQISAEYRGVISAASELDKSKRIHAGIEFNFYDMLFLRAGMNQRYVTFGGELSFAKFQLQFASYGEEIGTATAPREDRRFVGKIAVRF